MMQNNDYSRYASQAGLIGSIGQNLLTKSKVLCVGCGGLGSLLTGFLVAAGIGEITLIDGDKMEITNLTRQITYREEDCGRHKVLALRDYLHGLNSTCKVHTNDTFLDEKSAPLIIAKHDIIVDCSDNFTTRYLVSDTCKLVNKPLISGSVDGFMGQVMVFLTDVCYRCVFPHAKSVTSCSGGNVAGPVVGIIASMMANEVFKLITKFNQMSQLIQVNGLDNVVTRYHIKSDPACIINHMDDLLDDVSAVKFMTLDELRELNELDIDARDVVLNNTSIDRRSGFVLVDIRSVANKEFDSDSINLPLINLDKLLAGTTTLDLEQKIVVLCNYGYKSKITALQLARLGYKCVYHTGYQK